MLLAGSPGVSQPVPASPMIRVAANTPVKLMVLNEVTSHSAHTADRFPLLVDEAVVLDGTTVIAKGAKAWGEVVETHENGSAGTAGRLTIRLLWIVTPGGQVPLVATPFAAAGAKAFAQTAAMAAISGVMAPLALLARGNNAKFKAGERLTGLVSMPFSMDRTSGAISMDAPEEKLP